jgi:hypothetical protein
LDDNTYFRCSKQKALLSVKSCKLNRERQKLSCDGCETPDYTDENSIVNLTEHLASNPSQLNMPYKYNVNQYYVEPSLIDIITKYEE